MKKTIALSTAILMLLSALTGCSLKNDKSADSSDNSTASSEDSSTEISDISKDFEEITVIDNEYCTFKITGLGFDSDTGYTTQPIYSLKVSFENKTTNMDLSATVDDLSINGATFETGSGEYTEESDEEYSEDSDYYGYNQSSIEVAAGESTETLYPLDIDYSNYLISYVNSIEGTLRINEPYNDENVYCEEAFAVYPHGEDSTESVTESDVDDNVIFDTDDCKMSIVNCVPDGDLGYTLTIYSENKTDKLLAFGMTDSTIGGCEYENNWFAGVISGGECSYCNVYWDKDFLNENNIASVDEIKMNIYVCNSNDVFEEEEDRNYIISDTFTYNP